MKNLPIIDKLKTRSIAHVSQSIQRWKHAISAFESEQNPNRVALYDMYDDILLDGQLEAVWSKRTDAILNRRLVFVREGEENEEITRLLNSPDMRSIVRELLNSIAYGYTLIQINGIAYDEGEERFKIDFDLIPRRNVHPEKGFQCISRDPYEAKRDFLFLEKPLVDTMLWAGEQNDKGIFIKVAPYVIYKRGGFGDWAQFSEMFGMPFREAIYEAYDDDTRARVVQFMQEWAGQPYLVHNKDVEIKVHDTGGNASSAGVYKEFIAICDASIAKTILGNTLTTDQGESGARSLGEVHEREQRAKELGDENFILSILNTRFRAVLKKFGIDASGGNIWFENPEIDWTKIREKWEVINSVATRVPVSDDYIYEEIGIPKPDDYEQKRKELDEENAVKKQIEEKLSFFH